MRISLITFLRTGDLGELRLGMSKEEVRASLGEPDAMGSVSRKYPQPRIFLYGTVELNFEQKRPWSLTSLWWEAGEKGVFRLSPACEIVDWAFTPDWTFAQVEDYINALGLPYSYPDGPQGNENVIALENGVRLSFNAGKLYGLWR